VQDIHASVLNSATIESPIEGRSTRSVYPWSGPTVRRRSTALRARAKREARSMQDVARQGVRDHVQNHSKADLLDRVLDDELPRHAEALERLGQ
jgi:hypothetical protein